MSKNYLILLLFCFSQVTFGQCPTLDGAMPNSCTTGNTEGNNEFVYFTTAASAAISSYKLSYGSANPPTTATGILSGTTVSAKTGTGTIVIQNGCTLHEVTSSSTVIPADSRVILIPASFDQQYDFSGLCKDGNLYVAYIGIISPSKWPSNGTLVNGSAPPAAPVTRYLQLEYATNTCTSSIRSYNTGLWAVQGSVPEADGNSVSWDAQGNAGYFNNGCSIIITPVRLASFVATQKGKDVAIIWKTENEVNVKSYIIEWSSDGINFQSVGSVNATGNLSGNYFFSDKNITITGNNFYRLKTIDKDGTYSYSPIQKINFSGTSLIKVHQQVLAGSLTVELNALKPERFDAAIFDLTGRLLASKKLSVTTGYNKLDLNVNSLPRGEYILRLVNNDETNNTRFTKL